MEERMEDGKSGPPAPSRLLEGAFVAFLGLYYLVYSVVFARRVSEYFGDVLKHFEFVRRLF